MHEVKKGRYLIDPDTGEIKTEKGWQLLGQNENNHELYECWRHAGGDWQLTPPPDNESCSIH